MRITSVPVLLLWLNLCRTHFQEICVDGFQHAALDHRLGRQIKTTTILVSAPLNDTSGGTPEVSSPPVSHTIFSDILEPGWAVFANGSRGVRQQQVVGGVSSGSNAFCATLPDTGVSLTPENC